MRKYLLFVLPLVGVSFIGTAQNTVTSGNWNDPSVWSGGAVPLPAGTVNVNNPLTIDTNLSPTGTWTFNSNTTDQPGGTAYTFNPNAGTNTITISASTTVTFEGGTVGTPNAFNSGTIDIYGTLILGYTQFNNDANLKVTIKPGGTLIINGDLIYKNNSGTFTINGALIVYGKFDVQTGSVVVAGSGTIYTTGTITSNGGSTIFGFPTDCITPPCSGTSLACTFSNSFAPTSKTICSGSTAGTLTASTNATTPSYQWLSSTDGITYSNASGTSTNSTYVTPTLTLTTWYKVQITSSGPTCTSTSAATKVTVLSGGGWIGGTSNDWGTASNWCAGVPTSTTDVTISNASGVANMPSVNTGTAAVCRNLTINNTFPASSVSIAASATASLSIFGDFTNNGTFTDNSTASTAGVKFVGSVVQTIAGTTANSFNNLTLANTSGATPAINITTNNVTVNSSLTMTSGLINLNGFTITLGTAAASTGTLAYTAGMWFYSGNIERWFPTSSITISAVAGQFPIGTSTDYRPIYFGNGGLSAAGTIKIRHTATTGSTAVAPTFVDNAGTVALRSNSFWTVSTANGIGTGTHNLRTEGTGFGTVGAMADLRQTLVNTIAPGTDGAHAGTLLNPQVNRTGLTTANLSNNFYWGSVNATNTPLPVSLVSFTGHQVSDQINLSWKTASELNFNFFSIEKSVNGKVFFEFHQVAGHGTTNEEHQYESVDKNPLIGKNYYRLKSVDFDGTSEYFDIIEIDFSKEKRFSIYPNPSDGKSITTKINFHTDEEYTVVIFNSLGLMVGHYTSTLPETTVTFPVGLSTGIYYAKFSSPSFAKVARFVVAE
jgi:hypothetical protein